MAKIFTIEFPTNFPETAREALIEAIERQVFMPMPRRFTSQVDFFFESNVYTLEKFREAFNIPPTCNVTDTTNHWH